MKRRHATIAIVTLGLILGARELATAGPQPLRLAAAWSALWGLPALGLAATWQRGRRPLDALAVGAALSVALFSLIALLVHLGGGGLTLLLAMQPWAAAAAIALPVSAAPKGGSVRAPEPPASPGPSARALAVAAIGLGVALVAIALARQRPVDFRMDVYDHTGAALRVEARDRIFSYELGNGDEGKRPDPRKGTWNALFAGVLRLTQAEPLAMWNSAVIAGSLIGVLAFARLSREFLDSAWPLGVLFLLLAHEGGPGGAWFSRSAYPGVVGLWLYALLLAETLAAARGRARTPWLLALSLPLVHLMAGLLGAVALAIFLVIVLVRRRTARPAHPRALWGASLSLAAIVGIGLWRAVGSGQSVNPIQGEVQGVLYLTERLFVPELRTLYERLGPFGLLGLASAPLLALSGGRGLGWSWLLMLVVALVLLALPPLSTLIGTKLSYLLRRIPALVPLPLLFAAALQRIWTAAAAGSRLRLAARAAVLALSLLPLSRVGEAWALAVRAPQPATPAALEEQIWTPELIRLSRELPTASRVACDPITGYVLYSRTPNRPLVLPDQHGPPTDADSVERLAELARILSPWTADAERARLAGVRGVSHIIVNEAIGEFVMTFGYPVSPANAELLREHLDADPARYRLVARSESMHLYELTGAAGAVASEPPPNPYLVADEPEAAALSTACGIRVAAAQCVTERAEGGEVIEVRCQLSLAADAPALGDYFAFIALNPTAGAAGSFSKLSRWARCALGAPRDREVVHRALADGRYPVILWRVGETVGDQYYLRVPSDLAPGEYAVTMNIVRRPFYQNRRLASLLGDRDEYSTIPVGRVTIGSGGEGGAA